MATGKLPTKIEQNFPPPPRKIPSLLKIPPSENIPPQKISPIGKLLLNLKFPSPQHKNHPRQKLNCKVVWLCEICR